MFYGGGSANLGNPGEPYGGVLFAYNQSDALLWVPSATSGYLIYVGGLWGDDSDHFHSNNVTIKTTVIQAEYTGTFFMSVYNLKSVNVYKLTIVQN